MEITIKKIVEITKGILYSGDENTIITTYTKDTRTINKGDTYIGIKGEVFDGNKYYIDAFNKGAVACILEKDCFEELELFNPNMPIVLVNNSIEAIGLIASYIRDNMMGTVIGITGSVGKTSTRDLINNIIETEYTTLETDGNYNNNIGLPLTIMRYNHEDIGIIEMGMNHLNEISYLTKITKPNIGVITNVGTAHIGNLGNRENILKAKLEILDGMDDNSYLIIDNDNDLLHEFYLNNKNNIITVGIDNESDFMAKNIVLEENSSTFDIVYKEDTIRVCVPIPGISSITNTLLSVAVAVTLGIKKDNIIKGINNYDLTSGRMEIIEANNIKIINGVYNASVESMCANLEVLSEQTEARKIAVLGSMLELGSFSKELHEKVAEFVLKYNIDYLVTVGSDAKYIANKAIILGMNKDNIISFDNNKDASDYLKTFIKKDDAILLKASNGLKFKEILNELNDYIIHLENDIC